jgi:hypothetical protein
VTLGIELWVSRLIVIHHWKPALQSFQVMFGEDRVPLGAL